MECSTSTPDKALAVQISVLLYEDGTYTVAGRPGGVLPDLWDSYTPKRLDEQIYALQKMQDLLSVIEDTVKSL